MSSTEFLIADGIDIAAGAAHERARWIAPDDAFNRGMRYALNSIGDDLIRKAERMRKHMEKENRV